ncbi:TRAP transporter small permease [Pontixanthobacter aestiaquae]|uniref:TRAP transporter small permease protein n=1 Tax=Pontixanthobacter aestiaquae TaxID=1509367 RepID=A0A844ZAM3_9SPHN|nr:TRAP transporter small permease [Pontixanthobacter aestiaquae]MDN3644747.1 TRAP transporter small permease [Pontixanthobacter aestiaquae]MXO84246.1 TRAP transporter small permease subunit [Pontixanthobacter aestiaquae]
MMDKASALLVRLGAFGLIAMTAVIGWQVFGRFVLDSSPSWSEQTALVLMIWYVFLAAAAGVWERFHIRIEILEHRLSPPAIRWIRITIHLLIAGFGLVLAFYGAQLAWLVRDHVIPSLGISRAFAYLPIPLAGLLMTVFSIGRVRLRWRNEA